MKKRKITRSFDEVIQGLSRRYDPRRVRDIMSAPQPNDRSELSREAMIRSLTERVREAMGGVELTLHSATDGSISFDFFFDNLDDEVLFTMSYL
jgi:hypothetical protein